MTSYKSLRFSKLKLSLFSNFSVHVGTQTPITSQLLLSIYTVCSFYKIILIADYLMEKIKARPSKMI